MQSALASVVARSYGQSLAARPAGDPVVYEYRPPVLSPTAYVVWGLLGTASMAASAYHGVRRNRGSVGYGIWWGAMGALFPVITPAIAIAQGYGKPA